MKRQRNQKQNREKSSLSVTGTKVSYTNLPRQERPSFTDTLVFPDDITDLTARNVSDLLGKYTMLSVFAKEGLSDCRIEELVLFEKTKQMQSVIFRENPSLNSLNKHQIDRKFDEDNRIEGIRKKLSYQKQMSIFLDTRVESYDKYITALSRELSRRNNEFNPKYAPQ